MCILCTAGMKPDMFLKHITDYALQVKAGDSLMQFVDMLYKLDLCDEETYIKK